MAAAPAPTSAGVFGMARTTGMSPPSAFSSRASVTPAAIDNTRPQPAAAIAAQALDVVGLHRDHGPVGLHGLFEDRDAGELPLQIGPPVGQLFDDPELPACGPTRGEQAR